MGCHQKSQAEVGMEKATVGSAVAAGPWTHTEHRAAGAGRCSAKPHCARQAASRRVHRIAGMAPSASTKYWGGVSLLNTRATIHATSLPSPQTTPWESIR